jgi:small subunit ribosomal protein S11
MATPAKGSSPQPGAKASAPRPMKRKDRKNLATATAHVFSSFNNTIVTITDAQGNAVAWSSAGQQGFKGSRKGTPFAAQLAAEGAAKAAKEHGVRVLSEVLLKGPGSGRESALRGLQAQGIEIVTIRDITAMPHNGCKVRKRRRV